MTQIITHRASSFAGTAGALTYIKNVAGVKTAVSVTIPTGVGVTANRPYFAGYAKRTLIGGQWQQVMILTEDNTFHRAGIQAPSVAPYDATNNTGGLRIQATGGASSGGTYIGYVAFSHKIGETVVQRSNLSAGSPSVTITSGQSRSWSGIPTSSPNPRVTHVEFWLSVAGADPKFMFDRAIGLSTLTDSVLDGELLTTPTYSTRRGVPPAATLIEIYHDRAWYNDPSFPDRLYYSELNEIESVHSLNFIPTKDGEAITAIKARADELVVFCKTCSYAIQGFTADDFSMRKISSHIGCDASHSVVNLDDTVIFSAGKKGLHAYNAGFRPLSESDLGDYYRDDHTSFTAIYQDSHGMIDRDERVYKLLVPKTTGFGYAMTTDTSAPWIGTDSKTRKDYCFGLIDGLPYTGSDDGEVRQDNLSTDDDDDDDSAGKAMVIVTRHENGGDLPDREDHGKRWLKVTVFIKSPDKAIVVSCYPGEEDAFDATSPAYTFTIPASASTGYVGKNRSFLLPPNLVGSGLTMKLSISNAKNVEFRGYAFEYVSGPESRPAGS